MANKNLIMSFYEIVENFDRFDFKKYLSSITDYEIEKSIDKEKIDKFDLLNLLSDRAFLHIEKIAKKANELTNKYFGRNILLYAPIYISNFCTNYCIYCGFNSHGNILRKRLTFQEIEQEALKLKNEGIEHVLLLTGEDTVRCGFEYIKSSITLLGNFFNSVSIEVYPLSYEEYLEIKNGGLDGVTIYQEVYDEKIYNKVHVSGNKKDYKYRLDTPERVARAGIRTVNIGTLLGLGEVVKETFLTLLHSKYLADKYPDTELSISFPRINEKGLNFTALNRVDDRKFIQLITVARCFLPTVGITISTRENKSMRDNIIPLGVTKLSAGSRTEVGGYASKVSSQPQFSVCDERSIAEISQMLKNKNYQVVFKDWEKL